MKIIDLENLSIETTYMSILKEIYNIIISFDNVNTILTNCNLGSVLLDYPISNQYKLKDSISSGGKIYPIGQLGNIIVYVDPLMKISDKVIYLKNNDELIETIEIKDKNNILI